MALLAAEPAFARLHGRDAVGAARAGPARAQNSYHLLGVDLIARRRNNFIFCRKKS